MAFQSTESNIKLCLKESHVKARKHMTAQTSEHRSHRKERPAIRIPGCSSMRGWYCCALDAGPPPPPPPLAAASNRHAGVPAQQFSGRRAGVAAQLCQFSTLYRKMPVVRRAAGMRIKRNRAADDGDDDDDGCAGMMMQGRRSSGVISCSKLQEMIRRGVLSSFNSLTKHTTG